MKDPRLHDNWIGQCEAPDGSSLRFSVEPAFGYIAGEKSTRVQEQLRNTPSSLGQVSFVVKVRRLSVLQEIETHLARTNPLNVSTN